MYQYRPGSEDPAGIPPPEPPRASPGG